MTVPPDLTRSGSGREASRLPSASRSGARALLVEDERIVGELLAEFLCLEGYEVDRVMDGRQALTLARRRPYALIVSDVRMPVLDGPALYYELRAESPELARRMVFVTGDIMNSETRQFLDETCLRYLEKPFTIAEFRAVVQGVRGDARGSGPPAPDAGMA